MKYVQCVLKKYVKNILVINAQFSMKRNYHNTFIQSLKKHVYIHIFEKETLIE